MLDRTGVQQAIVEILADQPSVIAAYLFGSVARGTAGPLSDIDVGLLFAGRPRANDEVLRPDDGRLVPEAADITH